MKMTLPDPLPLRVILSSRANDCTLNCFNPTAGSWIRERTDVSGRRVSLAEYFNLEPLKPTESQTEQLYLSSFAGGSNPFLFIRQQGGMFSPRWVFGSSQSHESKHLLLWRVLEQDTAPLPASWMDAVVQHEHLWTISAKRSIWYHHYS